MTNPADAPLEQPTAPSNVQPAIPPTGPSAHPTRKRSAGHIVAIVIGCLMLLPGLGLIAGGGSIAIAKSVAADDDGYFSFTVDRIESGGVAVTTTHLWFDDIDGDASPWVLDWLDLDLRLRVDGAAETDDVFVGIARSADVDRYLDGSRYSQITELDDHTPRYRQIGGSGSVAPPADQDFWTVSASGTGEQEVEWEARGGRWSVVVMNADGTPNVDADVEVGARSGAITPIAITLLVVGGAITITAIVLIVIGARGRRTPPSHDGPLAPLPTPVPGSAVQLDRDENQPTPVG